MLEAPFGIAPKLFRGGGRFLRWVVFTPPLERSYAMSFLMRSIASTVASASPKAVRRT